jgi:hypothetical protein
VILPLMFQIACYRYWSTCQGNSPHQLHSNRTFASSHLHTKDRALQDKETFQVSCHRPTGQQALYWSDLLCQHRVGCHPVSSSNSSREMQNQVDWSEESHQLSFSMVQSLSWVMQGACDVQTGTLCHLLVPVMCCVKKCIAQKNQLDPML